MIDLVVYTGDKSKCDKCDLIERIHSDYAQRKYVLREIERNLANNDVSLNRCAMEKSEFLPEMFKLGDGLLSSFISVKPSASNLNV